MKEFVLIFRNSENTNFKPSPEQIQEVTTSWMNWMQSFAAQNKLADKGNRLSKDVARIIRAQ